MKLLLTGAFKYTDEQIEYLKEQYFNELTKLLKQ